MSWSTPAATCLDCGAVRPPIEYDTGMSAPAWCARLKARSWRLVGPMLSTDKDQRRGEVCPACCATRDAASKAAALTELAQVLQRSDLSHATFRPWCGTDVLHVYCRDPESPTGVRLVGGCTAWPEALALLDASALRQQAPGQMGEAAARAGMRGGR